MRRLLTIIFSCCTFAGMAQENSFDTARRTAITVIKKLLVDEKVKSFSFKQENRAFGHFSRPWQTDTTKTTGGFTIAPGTTELFIADSFKSSYSGKTYSSFQYFNGKKNTYRDTGYVVYRPTDAERANFVYKTGIYTPAFILNEFLEQPETNFGGYHHGPAFDTIIYNTQWRRTSIIINPANNQVNAIQILYAHEMYGDVLRTISYSKYLPLGTGAYPSNIKEQEHGVITNDITVTPMPKAADIAKLQKKIPAEQKEEEKENTSVGYTKFSNSVHFIDIGFTKSHVLVVEFKDFFLVAGAPLNTENGETVLLKLKEIHEAKFTKYFIAGHHHPHYLGGVRAFVRRGATILSYKDDTQYIRDIVSAPHTLRPDLLEERPAPLLLDSFDNEKTITDGETTVRIIHIGQLSHHTDDYCIFYFPEQKLLYHDDIAYIPAEGAPAPASIRQQGLYEAIKKYNLDVEYIAQGWPTTTPPQAKNFYFMSELEESIRLAREKEAKEKAAAEKAAKEKTQGKK